jgi:hypothetical protein
MRKVILVAVIALAVAGGIAASQTQKRERPPVDSNGRIVVTPEMIERARMRKELLESPDSLSFKIGPKSDERRAGSVSRAEDGSATRFKVGDEMSFEVSVTNRLNEPIMLIMPDTYRNFRPQLLKGGEPVSYSDAATQFLESRKIMWATTNMRSETLEPGQTRTIGFFNMKAWYEPLKPGSYQLLLKYSLERDMKWVELPPVDFEVVP